MESVAVFRRELDELAAWRRELHRHPEPGFEEHRTAAFVAEKLRAFGVDEVHAGIAGTGVVGVIRGRGEGPAIALRADMDALPIAEETNLPWASRVPGWMHACGHDGHVVMLLAAARHLARSRDFAGTVHLVFQPAEEMLGGGRRMVEEGLFERFPAREVYGLHNWPWLPLGTFAVHEGPVMAAADRLDVVIEGRGCHAAMPHLGRDPVTCAAQVITALQLLVSRESDPVDAAVISITAIQAGEAYNVVPERAVLKGTVRTLREETRARLLARIPEVVRAVATALGLEAQVAIERGYPATVNTEPEAEHAAGAAAAVAGAEAVRRDQPPSMGAEDFAFMLRERPGAYVWLGTGGAEKGRILHSPHYDFEDEAIPYGAAYWVELVRRRLPLG